MTWTLKKTRVEWVSKRSEGVQATVSIDSSKVHIVWERERQAFRFKVLSLNIVNGMRNGSEQFRLQSDGFSMTFSNFSLVKELVKCGLGKVDEKILTLAEVASDATPSANQNQPLLQKSSPQPKGYQASPSANSRLVRQSDTSWSSTIAPMRVTTPTPKPSPDRTASQMSSNERPQSRLAPMRHSLSSLQELNKPLPSSTPPRQTPKASEAYELLKKKRLTPSVTSPEVILPGSIETTSRPKATDSTPPSIVKHRDPLTSSSPTPLRTSFSSKVQSPSVLGSTPKSTISQSLNMEQNSSTLGSVSDSPLSPFKTKYETPLVKSYFTKKTTVESPYHSSVSTKEVRPVAIPSLVEDDLRKRRKINLSPHTSPIASSTLSRTTSPLKSHHSSTHNISSPSRVKSSLSPVSHHNYSWDTILSFSQDCTSPAIKKRYNTTSLAMSLRDDSDLDTQLNNDDWSSTPLSNSVRRLSLFPGGMPNTGNSCYLASVAQVIACLERFVKLVLGESIWDRLGTRSSSLNSQMSAWDALRNLLKAKSRRDNSIDISALKMAIGRRHPVFSGHQQQDPHEFLTSLLTILEEDFLKSLFPPPRKSIDASLLNKSMIGMNSSQDEENSLVTSIDEVTPELRSSTQALLPGVFAMEGSMAVQFVCRGCGHRYDPRLDVYRDLPLELPQSFNAQVPTFANIKDEYSPVSVEALLSAFLEAEERELSCPKCGPGASVLMRKTFASLPPILTLQIKRFTFCMRTGEPTKLVRPVHFQPTLRPSLLIPRLHAEGDTETVNNVIPQSSVRMAKVNNWENYDSLASSASNTPDIETWKPAKMRQHFENISSNCSVTPERLKNIVSDVSEDGDLTPSEIDAKWTYRLVGVIHHFGIGINRGHCVADTRTTVIDPVTKTEQTRWLRFDDSLVTAIHPSSMWSPQSSPYLLFYELLPTDKVQKDIAQELSSPDDLITSQSQQANTLDTPNNSTLTVSSIIPPVVSPAG